MTIEKKIDKIAENLDLHIKTYNKDMRGDMDLSNGNRGMVNEIREIKKTQQEYPSLMWLLSHKTLKTAGGVLGVLTLYQVIWYIGLVGALGKVLGLDLEALTETAKIISQP